MKNYKIKISGMTCSRCEATVSEAIQGLKDVIEVSVSLKSNAADIKTEKNISIKDIQNVLPNKFTAHNYETHKTQKAAAEPSYLKKLYPLGLILFYISIASTLLNLESTFEHFMIDFMGLFFIVFSFFKFLDYQSFPKSFAMYDPLAKNITIYGWIYPFIETVLGLMFIFRVQIILSLILTIVFLGITTIGVIKTLKNKEQIQCACLGTAIKLPMTVATLIENGIMIVMAIIMISNYVY
jgi:copper chaperone CopZ